MSTDLKNKAAKGLVWGGFFTVLQQLVSLSFSIIIARRLMPSDYGMVGMLAIFTALATVLQESGFVFVLTNRKEVTKSEYSTVFWFNVIISFCIYTLFFLLAPLLGSFYNNIELVPLSRYVFLGFFISSFGVVQSAVLYKEMRVREKGMSTFIGSLSSGIIGVILAYNGFAYWGLATQGLVSTFVSTLILWYYSPFRPLFHINFSFLKAVLPTGIVFALSNMVSVISNNIYSLILGKLYTVQDVGFYSQATKFQEMGNNITLGMIRNVSQPMLVQVKDNKELLLNAFRKLVRFTALLSIPIMLGLGLVAPELVTIVLTSKWEFSGVLLRILCIGGSFAALSNLATYFFISLNKSSLYMWLGIINSITRIVLVYFASLWGVISLAYMCAAFEVLCFVFYYYIVNKNLNYSFRLLLKDIFPVLSSIVIALAIAFFVTTFINNIIVILVLRIIISVVLFILIMYFWKYDVYEEAKALVINKIKIIL